MAIFKCKICGGTLEITSGETVATCEYCGTKQTLPKLDDEKKANLFDRANHFRRNNDFDKAMGIYEQILNEDTEDAESYWSIVLCRYGIEYVEDPSSRKRVPTVNRAQFTSVFDDEDYKSAIKYADAHQKELYEKEATAINEIQKGILAISGQEKPFDVFICYKETDASGRRTQDSVLATELYHELTREGYKVFFSRITLEDKLGTAYEPYIFAALNSSKVMVVLGTKPEHFTAVWVRNEWSRYLALIKQGQKKMLIPAYRDMDPYDLPEEFSHLQAQDMSKLGFMQDLVRGITKLVSVDNASAVKETVVVQSSVSGNASALVKRGFLALEDGNWNKADEFFEQALNQDAEDAQAYLGKLMAELQVKTQSSLKNCKEPFDNSTNYQKAIRFADSALASELKGYISFIKDRNAKKARDEYNESIYLRALEEYKSSDIGKLNDAIELFTEIADWKDSKEFIGKCQAKIEQIRVQEENERIERERLAEEKRLEDERQKELKRIAKEKAKKRNKKLAIIITPIIALIVAFVIVLNFVIIPNSKYNAAIALMNYGKYDEAISAFELLDGYKDSNAQIENCQIAIMDGDMQKALALLNEQKYDEAYAILSTLGNYDNASDKILQNKYDRAIELFNKSEFDSALLLFSQIHDYQDSTTWIDKCNDGINEKVYQKALELYNSQNHETAKQLFETIPLHKDSKSLAKQCGDILSQKVYDEAEAYLKNNDWYKAATTFYSIKDYSDAKTRSLTIWRDNLPQSTVCTKTSITSSNTFAITNDGKVLATGELNKGYGYTDFSSVKDWTNIISISANGHILGLKKDGTVVAVGSNDTNELAVSSWRNIVQISAGGQGSFGVKSDGTVVSTKFIASSSDWKKFDYGQNDISSWEDIVYISASDFHTVGLKADGTVVAVGKNDDGLQQCGVDSWKDIVFIAAHTTGTYGVKADGTVVKTTSGYNVSSWRNIKSISVGDYHIVGLKQDGTVVATGGSVADNGELDVSNMKNIVAVVAGYNYTVALKSNGTLSALGLVNHSDGRGKVGGWSNIKIP